MKIANTKPTQFSTIAVSCSDAAMASILSQTPGTRCACEDILAQIQEARRVHSACWMFDSGAKLGVSEKRGFYIYCYASDGHDGVEAVAELNMLYHLNRAAQFYRKMQEREFSRPRRRLVTQYQY